MCKKVEFVKTSSIFLFFQLTVEAEFIDLNDRFQWKMFYDKSLFISIFAIKVSHRKPIELHV